MRFVRIAAVCATVASIVTAAGAITTHADNQPPARVIEISARRYEFSPDQIVLKRGEPVKLVLTSQDRTHGFFMKALKIDTDIKPGQTTEVDLTPETPGTYTTICDHYCGVGHGNMHMTIVVQ